MKLAYLGPEGSFTHQAADRWVRQAGADAVAPAPLVRVGDVFDAVADGSADRGVVAIENTVEGYVVPSLDAIVSSPDVVAVDEVVLDIAFDAFVRPGHGELTEISAHPHGLAQCQDYVVASGLDPVPAASNAAACRDIQAHQVALGPQLCGELYGLTTLARGVEDFHGARTRFLTLARRDVAAALLDPAARPPGSWRTMLAVTPTVTGPGVLARITAEFGRRSVNLSSLITRPVKAVEGKYVFIMTVDAAPWEPAAREVLAALLAAGDSLKTLGVLPARGELDEAVHRAVDPARVPAGGVVAGAAPAALERGLLWS